MRWLLFPVVVLVFLFTISGLVSAEPNGAQWGGALPGSGKSCSSCHFDGEPIHDSGAISAYVHPGEPFLLGEPAKLYVQFQNPDQRKVGIQIITTFGVFSSTSDLMETKERQARSTRAVRSHLEGRQDAGVNRSSVIWSVDWMLQEVCDVGRAIIHVAVNESNDDQSPMGDMIHYKAVPINLPCGSLFVPAEQ